MSTLLAFFKGAAIKSLLRKALRSALKAYVIKTDNKIDDTILSMVLKIREGQSIDDEIAFIMNKYMGR